MKKVPKTYYSVNPDLIGNYACNMVTEFSSAVDLKTIHYQNTIKKKQYKLYNKIEQIKLN